MITEKQNTFLPGVDEHWFKYLLGTLITVFFIVPLFDDLLTIPFPWSSKILYLLVFLMILIGAIRISNRNSKVRPVCILVGFMAMLMNVLFLQWPWIGFMIIHHLLMVMVLGYFTISLTVYFFNCRSVTHYTIYAALSSYLMIALIWALMYGTIDMLQPDAFNVSLVPSPGGYLYDQGNAISFPSFYYSIITITTLGYGDIIPLSDSARALSSAEAFTGQMFIAITIARLVGIYSAQKAC